MAAEEWGSQVVPRDDAAAMAAEEWGSQVVPRNDAAPMAGEEWGRSSRALVSVVSLEQSA
ncbi:hypothetical protein MPSD_38890 [Mycobacterium pseudoshottsii JCM 15466]|nr:hypothetical protein MPSD_38890 [Mycobacterium pseudoshottsii JCM 15466]